MSQRIFSVKALLAHFASTELTKEGAEQIRALIEKDSCRFTQQPYNTLRKIDEIFGVESYGVEYTATSYEKCGFEYVNFGDSYTATILYDYHTSRYRLTSWGDLVESHPSRY